MRGAFFRFGVSTVINAPPSRRAPAQTRPWFHLHELYPKYREPFMAKLRLLKTKTNL